MHRPPDPSAPRPGRSALSRRGFLRLGAGAGAGLLLTRSPLAALSGDARPGQDALLRRAIPRSGERLPVIGLGSVGTFNLTPGDPRYEAGVEVVRRFAALGGTVIDTAPGYPNAEPFVGQAIQRLGIADEVFLATKFNALQLRAGAGVRPSGGLAADREEMEAQMAESLRRFGRTRLDLQQVWNLGDIQSNAARSNEPAGYLARHLEKAFEWKAEGRTRYVGITTSREPQYAELEDAMHRHPLDFVQLDYAIDNVSAGERLLPAAADTGTAVLVNRPFGSGALFRTARDRDLALPPWSAELGIASWAQFFLKFIVAHPAVTAAIPATSNPDNLRDNMGAGVGPLPDAAARRRMLEFWREATA